MTPSQTERSSGGGRRPEPLDRTSSGPERACELGSSASEQLILDTEQKVALQWAKASGELLRHSGGFSFRPGRASAPNLEASCSAMSPVAASSQRVVVRPTGRVRRPRRRPWLAAILILAVGLGIGAAAHAQQPSEPQTPAFLF